MSRNLSAVSFAYPCARTCFLAADAARSSSIMVWTASMRSGSFARSRASSAKISKASTPFLSRSSISRAIFKVTSAARVSLATRFSSIASESLRCARARSAKPSSRSCSPRVTSSSTCCLRCSTCILRRRRSFSFCACLFLEPFSLNEDIMSNISLGWPVVSATCASMRCRYTWADSRTGLRVVSMGAWMPKRVMFRSNRSTPPFWSRDAFASFCWSLSFFASNSDSSKRKSLLTLCRSRVCCRFQSSYPWFIQDPMNCALSRSRFRCSSLLTRRLSNNSACSLFTSLSAQSCCARCSSSYRSKWIARSSALLLASAPWCGWPGLAAFKPTRSIISA